jgi:hypothetical protein
VSADQPHACICPPDYPENVTDVRCPQHGILALLASGALAESDDPKEDE